LKMLDVSDRIFHIRDGKLDRVEAREEAQIRIGSLGNENGPGTSPRAE
jgi:hypothetical protein